MVRTGGDITITTADDWANLQGESIFGKAVDQSKAPADGIHKIKENIIH